MAPPLGRPHPAASGRKVGFRSPGAWRNTWKSRSCLADGAVEGAEVPGCSREVGRHAGHRQLLIERAGENGSDASRTPRHTGYTGSVGHAGLDLAPKAIKSNRKPIKTSRTMARNGLWTCLQRRAPYQVLAPAVPRRMKLHWRWWGSRKSALAGRTMAPRMVCQLLKGP